MLPKCPQTKICYGGYTIKMHKHAHFVITIWRLGEVETQQVVRFGTVLPVTHHQLASLSTAETEVLVCVFALWPQLPLLRLQLGVPGFLLLLHHHCTLDQTPQKEQHQTQLPKVWTALKSGSRRSMSSPLAAPRGIRSSCLTHSYKMFSCCPHSGGCSWMSALCLQEHSTLNKSFNLVAVHEMYKDTRRSGSRNSNSNSIYVHSPASMSQSAKSPIRTSPFTVHFCVSQFGLQLWFINRAEFPLGPASITRSCEARTKVKIHDNLGIAHWGSLVRVSLWCHSCYLGEGEHVEVGHVIFMSTFDSLLALLWVYHLSHILGHKVTLATNNKFTVYIF